MFKDNIVIIAEQAAKNTEDIKALQNKMKNIERLLQAIHKMLGIHYESEN